MSVLDDLRELKVFFDFAYICLSFDCAFPWCIQEALTFRRTSPLNSLVLVFEDLLTKGVGDHLTDHPWYRQNWIRPEKAVDWTTADIEWSAYLYSFAGNQGSFGQWIDHVSLCLCLPWLSLTVHSHNNKRISHSPIFPSQIAHPWIAAILNHPFYIFTYYPGLRPLSGPNKEGENEVKGNTPLYVVHTGSNHFMSLVSVFPDIDAN